MDSVIYGFIVEVDVNHFMYCNYKGIQSFSTRDEAFEYAKSEKGILLTRKTDCEVLWFPSIN